MATKSTRATRAKRTIDELITAYLAETAGRAGGTTGTDPESSLDLLRHGLNGYGYQHLRTADIGRWREAFDQGEEDALCRIAGTTVLLRYLDEFLRYFLIRKVMLSDDEVAAVVEDIRGFVEWLQEQGEISRTAGRKALGRIATASADLPAAERLSDILHDLARKGEAAARRRREVFDETVEDYLVIERVAPGRLWFLDGIGPLKVPEAASAVARPGWTVNLVLGRRGTTWVVLEVGNVYPETLA